MTAHANRNSIDSPVLRASSAVYRSLWAGLKGLQYGQIVSVLNRLPDTYLKDAGLERRDIPERARRSVYGDV